MNDIESKVYYETIKKLNVAHYAGEVAYYIDAPLRSVEKKLLAELVPGSDILDLGCGAGRFSLGAAQVGFNVFGIDITAQSVRAAKDKAAKTGLKNIRFMVGDMTELPFESNSFNYVFCPRFSINAVATIERRRSAVAEMLRVVKKDGIIFIESFNWHYLGKGPIFFLRNVVRDGWRWLLIYYSKIANQAYTGLLPGDIVYDSNKVVDAPEGYAHLPTICELKGLIPKNINFTFYSIPQITSNQAFDLWKYCRYSIWLIIKKD